MKKLIAIIFTGLITTNLFGFETDEFKYIPKGTNVFVYDLNRNGKYDMVWWDRNKDGNMQPDEIFIDLNEDGIPDISYKEMIEM